ncbi:cytochrome P450 [Georgenia sp. AZ-5]|uniref:cytochrome P450 n=1 Tax=Georgenia sp. AZ-5 TaxID=3367526 RepID=UPI0037541A9F
MSTTSSRPVFDVASFNKLPDFAGAVAEIRREGSIVRSEDFEGFYAVLGYSDLKSVAADSATFCSGQGATIPRLGNQIPAVPTETDPPEHRDYRKLMVPELRPDRVTEWEGEIRQSVDDCIDAFIERGSADLAAELAHIVPPRIITRIIGLPEEDGDLFATWTTELNHASTSKDPDAKAAAAKVMLDYVDGKVTAARATAGASLLHRVANAEINGVPISHEAAIGAIFTLVIAGHETTVNGIGALLWLVGAHPAAKRLLLHDRSLVDAAVEEALRLESPVLMAGRTVTAPASLGGIDMSVGDRVALHFGAANLDAEAFDRPGEFNIERDKNPHVAFGHGIHRCVGEHLARAEMRIALERVLDRIPDYEVTGDVEIGGSNVFTRGPRAVPVRFTPGSRFSA